MEFLRHQVDEEGVRPLQAKVQTIQIFRYLRFLREFLGLINCSRRVIPHCANLTQPLTDLLADKVKNRQLQLDEDTLNAFNSVESALAQATPLSHSSTEALLSVMVNALISALGGGL